MSILNGDASDFYRLADDLAGVGLKAVGPVRAAMLKGGESLRDQWKTNAAATSGKAAAKFPAAIEARPTLGVTQVGVEVGPFAGGQGKLGHILEFGSYHSPAHLDGLHALDTVQEKVQADFTAAVSPLFK